MRVGVEVANIGAIAEGSAVQVIEQAAQQRLHEGGQGSLAAAVKGDAANGFGHAAFEAKRVIAARFLQALLGR